MHRIVWIQKRNLPTGFEVTTEKEKKIGISPKISLSNAKFALTTYLNLVSHIKVHVFNLKVKLFNVNKTKSSLTHSFLTPVSF